MKRRATLDAREIEGSFHCSAEWHLYQLSSGLACPIYTWGFRLTKRTGVFSASAENVAEYFSVNRKTALSALEELAEIGFFVIDRSERFKPNTYNVISHTEWAKRNPNRCTQKLSFPWDGQGDPLGRDLYRLSGGRLKFWPRQMTGLRNLGFSDDQIIERFQSFFKEASYRGPQWKDAYYDFRDALAGEIGSRESSRTDSARVQSNGHHRVQWNGPKSSKEVADVELTIPAAPLASTPVNKIFKENKDQKERHSTHC